MAKFQKNDIASVEPGTLLDKYGLQTDDPNQAVEEITEPLFGVVTQTYPYIVEVTTETGGQIYVETDSLNG